MAIIARNLKKDGIEIFFNDRQSQEVKTWLSENRFRWSKFSNLYWKKFSEKDWTIVHEYFNIPLTENFSDNPEPAIVTPIDIVPIKEQVMAKFTFMATNPMKQGQALKALTKKVRADGRIMTGYEYIESMETGLKVESVKIHSSKAAKGYTNKLVIGEHIVSTKAEQLYYQYLQGSGLSYSDYLKEKQEQDSIEQEKKDAERKIRDTASAKTNSELQARRNEAQNALYKKMLSGELTKELFINEQTISAINYIDQLKSKKQTVDIQRQLNTELGNLESKKQTYGTIYDQTVKLYELKDGNVVPKYAYQVGDKVIVTSWGKNTPTIIESQRNNPDGSITYIVEKKDDIYNVYLGYASLEPEAEALNTPERFHNLTPAKTLSEFESNIEAILEQYSGREMGSIQVESYLNQYKDTFGKEYLAKHGIKSRDELKIFTAKLQAKAREGKGRERSEALRQMKQEKSDNVILEIEKMALEADAEMQNEIRRRDKKDEFSQILSLSKRDLEDKTTEELDNLIHQLEEGATDMISTGGNTSELIKLRDLIGTIIDFRNRDNTEYNRVLGNQFAPSGKNKPGSMRPDFMAKNLLKGREIQLSMPNGEKRNAIFAIVELDNITASHNEENFHSEPSYPKNASDNNINDRNYSGDLTAQKAVMDYARELEPERLITTSRTPSGTPIITKDGFVVSGNNRTMSLKLAAKNYPENYKEYVKFLSDEIESFGFPEYKFNAFSVGGGVKGYIVSDPNNINELPISFDHPVLVRIDLDFPEYTTQELSKYNKDTKKSERPIDKAIKLSNILRDNSRCAEIIAGIVGEYETFTEFYANIQGQKQLSKTLIECNLLTEQELPAFFSETTFTEAGKEFIESLLAALILDREALLVTEQPGVKAIRQKLITALPVLMKNATLPEGSLKQKFNDAVILQYAMKGSTFADFIRQRTMFGTTYDKQAVYINRLIDSGKIKFKQAIEGYNTAVMQNQGVSLFGENPSNEDIFSHWIVGGVSETDKKLIEGSDMVGKTVDKVPLDIISPDYGMKEFIEPIQKNSELVFKGSSKDRTDYVEVYRTETGYYLKEYSKNGALQNNATFNFNDPALKATFDMFPSDYPIVDIDLIGIMKGKKDFIKDHIIIGGIPKYDKQYLDEKIEAATPNLSKIKDVDAYLDEIRGEEPELDKIFLREAEGLKIFLVDGEQVRKSHIEFVSGGHGYVYDWVPKDEVWIDENQKYKPNDMEATIKHELFEIGKMRDEGLSYDDAHELANAMEKEVRNNNEPSVTPFKKDDYVVFKESFRDKGDNFTYQVIEEPDGLRAKVMPIDTKLNIPPVYVVNVNELEKAEKPELIKEIVKEFPKPGTIEYYQRGIDSAEKLLANINFTGDIVGVQKRIETFKAEIAKLQPTQPDPKDDIAEVRLQKLMLLRKFISVGQHEALSELMMGEEGEAGWEIVDTLGSIIQTMPHTYQTEKTDTDDKIVYLHYFMGGSDWYVVEKDKLMPQNQAFGYAILGGDTINAEWGYISILELIQNGVELDFYFTPVKFLEVKKKWNKEKPEVTGLSEIDKLNSIDTESFDYWFERYSAWGGSEVEEVWDKYYKEHASDPDFMKSSNDRFKALIAVAKKKGIISLIKGEKEKSKPEVKDTFPDLTEKQLADTGLEDYVETLIKEEGKSISYTLSDYKSEYELNKAIEKALDEHWNDTSFFGDKHDFIRAYSGYGGLKEVTGNEELLKSMYEFYTPDKIVEKMWLLALKHQIIPIESIVEPSCGVGIFFDPRYVLSSVQRKTAYELNKYSARITKILYPDVIVNDGANSMKFEMVFTKNNYTIGAKIPTPTHDLVIGNPPYMEVSGREMGMGEGRYSHAKNYIDYFIFRGLDLLKKDGLLIYIVGAEVAAGGKLWLDQGDSKCKQMIAEKGKLIDAYRLPEGIFGRTNVVSDILIFRKK